MIWIVFARGGVAGIDQRSRLIETLADIERTSLDYYATIRFIYRQRRAALIHRTKSRCRRTRRSAATAGRWRG